METKVMEQLYHKAANQINDLIPEDWSSVYLYAQIIDAGGEVFFYYYPETENAPVYSFDILKRFRMDKQEFRKMNYDLYKCFYELREEFHRNEQELWTNLTFILKRTGELKLEYGYDDLSEADKVETQVIWEYKYLGIVPEGSWEKEMLEKYLRDKKQ